MRPTITVLLGLLVVASPSHGQQRPSFQTIEGFTISERLDDRPDAFCAITALNETVFSMRIVVTGGGNNVLSLINPAWNLTANSRGMVTLHANQRTLTKEFAPGTGDSAARTLSTIVRKDADSSEHSFIFSIFIPGTKTEIAFPAGQTFRFDAPPNNAYLAFKQCLDRLWAPPVPSADPFAKR